MLLSSVFFVNDTATTEIYTRKDTLSLHDALPIFCLFDLLAAEPGRVLHPIRVAARSEEHTSELQSPFLISYAVFCLKKKNTVTTMLHVECKSKDNEARIWYTLA